VTNDNHVHAEALAAWAEGRLARAESAAVETHLSSCAVCQEMLAVLARTAPEPRPDSSVISGFRWFRWQWAVPAAAAATAAAIWVAIPERRGQDEFERTIAPTIEEAAPRRTAESSSDAKAPAEETRRFESRRDAPALQDRLEKQAPAPSERDQDRTSELREREAPQAAAPQPAAAAQQAPPAPEQSRLSTETALLRAAPGDVVSPDLLVRWRIVPPGRLERSTNGGKTWESTPLPVAVDLVAVRAPSATTAIVTATDGRQFRTDDQGKTWNPVQP
jgi:hypothetical protein